MKPIRVLKFVSSFHTGGTERQFVLAATQLDRRRFEPHVGCFKRAGSFLGDVVGSGLPVSEYMIHSLYDWRSIYQRARLARYIRRHRIQLIHAYGFYPNLFAVPAARLAGARVVVASVRDSGDLWTPMQRRAQRAVLRLADHVVVNAHAVAEALAREGFAARRLSVIHNGIPSCGGDETSALRADLGLAADLPLVTVVSRLTANHGVDFKGIRPFLDAAARLAGRFADARFAVVGDGPSRADLETYAAGRGLSGRVIFTGFRRDIPDILASSTVAVLPSLTEGLSNSLLEAMAAGRPVVATRVGGNPEALGDGGLLVPPGDDAALAQAIAKLLVDPALRDRLGAAGRRRVERLFSVRRMLSETEALYAELVRERLS